MHSVPNFDEVALALPEKVYENLARRALESRQSRFFDGKSYRQLVDGTKAFNLYTDGAGARWLVEVGGTNTTEEYLAKPSTTAVEQLQGFAKP